MDHDLSKCILIVDDEPHVAHVLGQKLSLAGFDVLKASDGEEGFALAVSERPDLIITDDGMPELSGLDLAQRLKETPETAHIPVLMLTARGTDPPPERLEKTNIRLVLDKPFSPREILTKINEVLGICAEP